MRIHCGECEALLGELRPSGVALKGHRLVMHIEPGWRFVHGVLEGDDWTFQQERRLLHEMTGRERRSEGVAMARECDLPVRVRCRRCRRVRWVTADLVHRPVRPASAALVRSRPPA